MNDLQAALTAAAVPGSDVTEIRVAQGVYMPTRRVDPAEPRSATFSLINAVTLRGGYAGPGAPNPDAWDPESYVSTLSGDLAGDDAPGEPPGSENALHVTLFDAPTGSATIAGFHVIAGNANINNLQTFTHFGGGLLVVGAQLVVQACTFSGNVAELGGAAYIRQGGASFQQCTFIENVGTVRAGAIRWYQATQASMSNCTFEGNTSPSESTGGGAIAIFNSPGSILSCVFNANSSIGGGGGAIFADGGTSVTIQDSSFTWNQGAVGGAIHSLAPMQITSCQFTHNQADFGGGAVSGSSSPLIISRCLVSMNSAGQYFAGGILLGATTSTVSDCAIVDNTGRGGGVYVVGNTTLRNCTIVNNDHDGVMLSPNGQANVVNSIVWGNTPEQITFDDGSPPPPPSFLPGISVSYSNVQGGWAGSGNINLDPRLLQPGCGNVRLSNDSPCINAGSNAALPPGTLLDLDGQPRIQDGSVDMGAYEGPHEPLRLIACADNIDGGDLVNLVPAGGGLVPMDHPGALLIALQGIGASAQLEQTPAQLHAGVGGYWEIADILRMSTTLVPGGHLTRQTIPFDASDLGLLDYSGIDVTFFDQNLGRWNLAVASNVHDSPGHSGPIGDRIMVVGTDSNYGMTLEFGDYGVFWNPDLERGFAWANVDYHADFAIGAALPLCPADCAVPHDDIVGQADLLAVVAAWGAAVAGEPADTNASFTVDVNDLLKVIGAWGPCREP